MLGATLAWLRTHRGAIAVLLVITTVGLASAAPFLQRGCSAGDAGQESESACDHCVACVHYHGHQLAIESASDVAPLALCFGLAHATLPELKPDLLAASIFHPPLS